MGVEGDSLVSNTRAQQVEIGLELVTASFF